MQRRTLIELLGIGATLSVTPPAAAHPTWQGLRRARRHLRPRTQPQAQPRANTTPTPPGQAGGAVVVKDELTLNRRP